MIPKPLYQLTECGHEFEWTDACNSEFQEWKLRLISAPMQPSFFSLAHIPERLVRLCRCIVTMVRNAWWHMGVAYLKLSEGTVSREINCLCRHRYVAPLVLPLGLTLHSLHWPQYERAWRTTGLVAGAEYGCIWMQIYVLFCVCVNGTSHTSVFAVMAEEKSMQQLQQSDENIAPILQAVFFFWEFYGCTRKMYEIHSTYAVGGARTMWDLEAGGWIFCILTKVANLSLESCKRFVVVRVHELISSSWREGTAWRR